MERRTRTILITSLVGAAMLLAAALVFRASDADPATGLEPAGSTVEGSSPSAPKVVRSQDPRRAEVRPLPKPANEACPAGTAPMGAQKQPDGSSFYGCGSLDALKQVIREGDWTFIDAEQLTYAGKFVAGKKVGTWILWSASGKPIRSEPYEGGTLNGVQLEWSEDGQRVAERPFKDGALDGTVVLTQPDGTEVREPWRGGHRLEPGATP